MRTTPRRLTRSNRWGCRGQPAPSALGEIDRETLAGEAVGADMLLWSGRASTSAGIELMGHEIVVLGMSDAWSGPVALSTRGRMEAGRSPLSS